MPAFQYQHFREKFPLLATRVNNLPLVYFDNGATTQKPQAVLDSYQEYYQHSNANVHRASHAVSAKATLSYEQARLKVQHFIGAKHSEEIIWTKGSTESINLIAQSWGRSQLSAGDEIVLSQSEHHANIVPWQIVAEQTGALIKVLPLTASGKIEENQLSAIISSKTKVVSVAHISNVLGRINPLDAIIAAAKKVGAITVVDGAQAVAHQQLNVEQLGCDFYVFSAHKMYGPTGVGVLYGKKALLNKMPVYQGGGEMIKKVSFNATSYNQLPFKFEAGTPNIAGVVAFAAAINFLQQQNLKALAKYEQQLGQYCYQQLTLLKQVKFISEGIPDIPLLSFAVEGHHNHDIAMALDSYGIAVRSGHHCAMPLMAYLHIDGCLRVSLAAYNTKAEVDYFIKSLQKIISDDAVIESAQADEVKAEQRKELSERITDNTGDNAANAPVAEMIDLFSRNKGWDNRHRQIMLLGKKLPRMDQNLRNEDTLISGCESLAWLSYQKQENEQFVFTADSDAKVIRGLLMIVLTAFNDKTAEQIHSFDLEGYFSELGLLQHLSPSRGNGLKAIVNKILTLTG